jgi:hypothetical protein
MFFFFSNFSRHTKSDDQPQIDLAKHGYKTNRQVKKFRFPITCLQTNKTYELNMMISKLKKLKIIENHDRKDLRNI